MSRTAVARVEGRPAILTHLAELKRRLVYCAAAFLLAAAVSYAFAEYILAFLAKPLMDAMHATSGTNRLIFTNLTEAFFTYIKLALFSGLFLSFPVHLYHVWGFVSPGLYKDEQRGIAWLLVLGPVLFLAGAAMAYYAIMPMAWKFFLGFQHGALPGLGSGMIGTLPLQLEARLSEYLALVMQIILAFGLCFQMPLILILLARMGIITADGMAKCRRYVLVIIFAVAGILTPPDILSQFGLAIPMLVFYEVAILAARRMEKQAEKTKAEE